MTAVHSRPTVQDDPSPDDLLVRFSTQAEHRRPMLITRAWQRHRLNEQDAEDCLHDAILRFAVWLRNGQPVRNMDGMITTIFDSCCRDWHRSQSRLVDLGYDVQRDIPTSDERRSADELFAKLGLYDGPRNVPPGAAF